MKDDKLRELEEFIKVKFTRFTGGGEPDTFGLSSDHFNEWITLTLATVPDLITSYRELQKEADRKEAEIVEILRQNLVLRGDQTKDRATIKELLSALKPFASLGGSPQAEKYFIGTLWDSLHRADQVYAKHSTDINRFETMEGRPIDKLADTEHRENYPENFSKGVQVAEGFPENATILTDIHRLLEGLKPLSDEWENLPKDKRALLEEGAINFSRNLDIDKLTFEDLWNAHHLRTELIKTYGER